jgi:CheY-like chemotaxis protein
MTRSVEPLTTSRPSGGCLLVVDDEPAIRTLVRRILESDGFRVAEASSAQEALRVLAVHNVVLLITDIQMPGMSGLELAEAVKVQRPDLPVLLMSASLPEQVGAKLDRPCSFLQKPFSGGDLTARVRNAIA